MTYKTEIIAKLSDSEKWPTFDKSDFLTELNIVADEAFERNTVEGYLAAILIYSQITEDMVKLLLECCDFIMQVAVFPMEIQFKRSNKRMFGQILSDLENTLSFENKQKFLDKCKELNEVRNRMVHNLTIRNSIISPRTWTRQ